MAEVLCGANSYTEKYYFNDKFSNLPESVQQELQILCVLFVEEVGGVLTLEFLDDGTLTMAVSKDDKDYLFDEIGSELKIREVQKDKLELLMQVELYYRTLFLGQDPEKWETEEWETEE